MKIFTVLYYVSVGVWLTSLFITARYDDPAPMWIALIAVIIFDGLSIWKDGGKIC